MDLKYFLISAGKEEILLILKQMDGTYKIMVEIIYGGGLRLSECLYLRIKDIDFQRQCMTVRSGKGMGMVLGFSINKTIM